jgi:hypothetical protein
MCFPLTCLLPPAIHSSYSSQTAVFILTEKWTVGIIIRKTQLKRPSESHRPPPPPPPPRVDCVWNVMAHVQKPDFVFRQIGRVHLNRWGASVQSTTGRRAVHITLQSLYYSCKPVFCSHVTLTGCPLHSLVSPSLLRPVRHRVPSHFKWILSLILVHWP